MWNASFSASCFSRFYGAIREWNCSSVSEILATPDGGDPPRTAMISRPGISDGCARSGAGHIVPSPLKFDCHRRQEVRELARGRQRARTRDGFDPPHRGIARAWRAGRRLRLPARVSRIVKVRAAAQEMQQPPTGTHYQRSADPTGSH